MYKLRGNLLTHLPIPEVHPIPSETMRPNPKQWLKKREGGTRSMMMTQVASVPSKAKLLEVVQDAIIEEPTKEIDSKY